MSRKITSVFLLLLFISLASSAQKVRVNKKQPHGTDLLVGIKVGLNFNKMSGEDWISEYKTNPAAGLFLALNGKRIGLQIEGLWTMNTFVTDNNFSGLYNQYFQPSNDSLATGKFTFHSFSIPVLLNYKLSQCLWIQVGPQYNSLLKELDNDEIVEKGKTIFSEGSLSAVAGLWLNIGKVGPIPRFNMGARYIAGVNNINELGDESKWRNQRVQLHIGFGF